MSKSVTYTAEQTAELVAAYGQNRNVEELALQFGRTVRSVIAKLTREGVYERKTVARESVGRKDELVLNIELFAKVEMKSLRNMTRADLEKLMDFIKREGQ